MAPTLSNTSKKPSTMKLLLLVSSFLASSTTSAFSPQPIITSVVSTSTSTSTSALHYTVAADLPPQQRQSIQENMRQVVAPTQQQQQQSTQSTQQQLPNMMDIDNLADFKRYVLDEPDRLTLVRFHAPFCRACKAMAPQLDRFARLHPHVNVVQIAWNKQSVETTQLIRALGVNKVPHGQLYVPRVGLVEEANLGKQYFGDVGRIVDTYQNGVCELPEDVNEYSDMYESPYTSLKAKGKRVPVLL